VAPTEAGVIDELLVARKRSQNAAMPGTASLIATKAASKLARKRERGGGVGKSHALPREGRLI